MIKTIVATLFTLFTLNAYAGDWYIPLGVGYADNGEVGVGVGLGYEVNDWFAGEALIGSFGQITKSEAVYSCVEIAGETSCGVTEVFQSDDLRGGVLLGKIDLMQSTLRPYVNGGAFFGLGDVAPLAGIGLQYKQIRLEANRIFDVEAFGIKKDVDNVLIVFEIPFSGF